MLLIPHAFHIREVIVLSENVRRYFLDTYGRSTHYIPNGITRPQRAEAAEIREKWGLEKDGYILALSRLTPEKGVQYLIDAYRQVKTDQRLVIAGGGSDTDGFVATLKKQAGEDGRILFVGFVQGRLLQELFSNAYCYVLPSDVEGMPLSLLEAMSYGNCCLVSDIPECTEVVGDRALTFQHGNVASLREQLQKLCGDPALADAVKAGADRYVCARYDWDDVVRRTLELYPSKQKR